MQTQNIQLSEILDTIEEMGDLSEILLSDISFITTKPRRNHHAGYAAKGNTGYHR